MKKVFYLSVGLLITTLFLTCKSSDTTFAPGAGDTRIAGTWQLVERRFPTSVDSTVIDSFLVAAHYEIDSITRDSVYRQSYYKKTLTKISRSVDTTIRYPAVPIQSLTFSTEGRLSVNGSDLSYYTSTQYFRVDSTISNGLGINLYVSTNQATVPFRINVAFQGNNLLILPRCERYCYSKFVRIQ